MPSDGRFDAVDAPKQIRCENRFRCSLSHQMALIEHTKTVAEHGGKVEVVERGHHSGLEPTQEMQELELVI